MSGLRLIGRRGAIGIGLAGLVAACTGGRAVLTAGDPVADLRAAEQAAGGALGIWVIDTDTGGDFGQRADEHFPHCSSFKTTLAALVLDRISRGTVNGAERLNWREADLLGNSPFTQDNLAKGASLRELARAAQVFSDNTATNLLLHRLGGPAAVTRFWRELGDDVSRLDNFEYELNHVREGEVHDTTTPRAMATTMARLLYGGGLSRTDAATLRGWMHDTRNGIRRVRQGLPEDWYAGDKPGTSGAWPDMGSAHADIGFIEPPGRAPITFAVYHRGMTAVDGMDPVAEQAMATAGATIARWAGG